MTGPHARFIQADGDEFTVRNASRSSGGRDTPDYSDDGSVVGLLERGSGSPQTVTDSSGSEITTQLTIQAVPDSDVTLREWATADGYPSLLVHPDGNTYRVLETHPEPSGVTVLLVTRD